MVSQQIYLAISHRFLHQWAMHCMQPLHHEQKKYIGALAEMPSFNDHMVPVQTMFPSLTQQIIKARAIF